MKKTLARVGLWREDTLGRDETMNRFRSGSREPKRFSSPVRPDIAATQMPGALMTDDSCWWQRFTQVELPFAAIGLVWNSMMSVAGGWFFLMACEMFVLGSRDFRLPGLGSYSQTAASAGIRERFYGASER